MLETPNWFLKYAEDRQSAYLARLQSLGACQRMGYSMLPSFGQCSMHVSGSMPANPFLMTRKMRAVDANKECQ